MSVFLREGDRVFRACSACGRGVDSLPGAYNWLDLTPLRGKRHVSELPCHDACAAGS